MSRPTDWWPLSEGDPVPGDPQTLASLGGRLGDAAAEIESMARTLPTLCTSEMWDSDAGEQFRVKAASTATSIGKAHRRFFTVSKALGNSVYGGSGYAAQLQECQEQADLAITAVSGSSGSGGSEADRRSSWFLLLDATHGADPTQPPAKHGAKGPAAGPMPQASPGVIPPQLPMFGNDTAEVAALKRKYNGTIDQLSSSAQAISRAVSEHSAAAHAAAQMIMTAIDNDGLKNPSGFFHWLDSAVDDVGGFIASHWVGFLKTLATVAGIIATVCGIIAMVLAFIPGMQAFAAAFETMALLAQAVAFVCHLVLFATRHGSLLDVIIDAVGLVTFGIGKGLIGSAEGVAEVAGEASTVYKAVAGDGTVVTDILDAGDAAAQTAAKAADVEMIPKMLEEMKQVVSVRPVFSAALKAFSDGKFGASLGDDAFGTLAKAFKSAMGMSSPEIGEALSKTVEAAEAMPYASGTAWGLTSRVEVLGSEFRLVQGTGVGADLTSKLDSVLHAFGQPLPGYDNVQHALPGGDS